MNRSRALLERWRSVRYESDTGFQEVINRLGQSGMLYAGLFAITLTTVHVSVHRFVLGHNLTWTYDIGDVARTDVALWDKGFIVILGLGAIALSRSSAALHWSRLAGGAIVLAVCSAILFDDVLNRDASFSAAYFALVLLVAVNTIPFKPWQTLILGGATIGIMALGMLLVSALPGMTGVGLMPTQMIYMALVVVVVTAITSLLYRYRYEQYAAQRNERALNHALEEHTRALELEKRKTEEQAERLTKMEELKSRFFSNVTHQFRTPLTLILGPTQDALEQRFGPLDAQLESQLDLVHRNGLRLQHLIDQLLDLSRLDAGGMRLDLKRGDIGAFLESLRCSFVPLAERKQISFEYGAPPHEVWADYDEDKLEKALSNLLSNAFKFTPHGGRVRLSLHVGDAVEIHVRDTGPGIPEAELPHVFDRFYQVQGVTGDATGSGIGLALAKELVELHSGSIRAESEVGFGTHVVISLPYYSDASPDAQLTPEVERASCIDQAGADPQIRGESDASDLVWAGEPMTVLIIDDNDDVRLYLRSHLEPRYAVLEAANGREGIELAQAQRPALVISDVMMPYVDGLEVCRVLKDDEVTKNIPIILLSARASEEARIEGLEARADDYMFKPFSATELLTRVENLIELRRMLWHAPVAPVLLGPSVPEVTSADQKFLEAVQAAVERHMGNTNFGVEWLADEVAISARQLQRRLQASVRLSAAGLIRMMRLQRAAQLLERRAGTVSEIAYAVGFQDAGYFSRLFKQTYGVTPTEYAEQHPPEDPSDAIAAAGGVLARA